MKRDGVDTAVFLISALLLGLVFINVEAWAVMLIVGGLHHEVSASIPAISYGGALLVTLALNVLAGLFRSSR